MHHHYEIAGPSKQSSRCETVFAGWKAPHDLTKLGFRGQIKIGFVSEESVPGFGIDRSAPRLRQPMDKRNLRVHLNRKPPIRRRDTDPAPRHAQTFLDHFYLIG